MKKLLIFAMCFIPLSCYAGIFDSISTKPMVIASAPATPVEIHHFDLQKEFNADDKFPLYSLGPKTFADFLVIFKPTIVFKDTYTGQCNYFVGYMRNGILYLTKTELNEQITWERYYEGSALTVYDQGSFKPKWSCAAFIKSGLTVSMTDGAEFYFAVQSSTDPSKLQGCRFKLHW